MDPSPDPFILLKPTISLSPSIRYDLLFILSTSMYHSLDYFILNDPIPKPHLFIFNIFQSIDLNIALLSLTLLSLIVSLKILIDLLYLHQSNFLTQILYQVLLPLQTHCFIRVVPKFTQTSSLIDFQTNTSLGVLFIATYILTFLLVFILKIKLNLRYGLQRQANFFSLSQAQFILTISKLVVGPFFSLIFSEHYFLYLIAVTIMNFASNFIFSIKVHYDNPKNEFLQLVSQFYRWIPVILGVLTYTNVQAATLQILSAFCLFVFSLICLSKPTHFSMLLQSKYLSVIDNFAQIRSKANQFKGNKISHTQITISYLSIAFSIFFKSSNGLKWSDNFKCEFLKSLVSYIQDTQRANLQRQGTEIIRKNNPRRTRRTTYLESPQTWKITEQVKQKYKSEYFQHTFDNYQISSLSSQNVILYNKLWSFVIYIIPQQSNVPAYLHFICDNLIDTTNLMKHQLLYFSYLIQSKSKGFFEKVDAKICHTRLIDLIGKQQINLQRNYETKYFDNQNTEGIMLIHQDQTQNISGHHKSCQDSPFDALQNSEVFCFHLQKPYFTNKFTNFIKQSQIFACIIEQLSIFARNQSFYSLITESKNQQKHRITQYFTKRNTLSYQLKEMINEYCELKRKNGKIYKSGVIRYIQNNWIKKDPIMALDEFRSELQLFSFSQMARESKYHRLFKNLAVQDDNLTERLVCMVSSIANPDKIFASSSQFKKLLQTDTESCDTDDSAQIQTKQNSQCSVNINSLMLPIFKEQHQNLSSSFYEKPIPHTDKRYFLMSKRRNNVLQTKQKMYFHMMYEHDLLIVLDIQAQKITQLLITDKDKKKIIFEHSPNRLSMMAPESKRSIGKDQSPDAFRHHRRSSSVYPTIKDQIGTRLNGMKGELVTLFNRQYNIFVKRQPFAKLFQRLAMFYMSARSGTHNDLSHEEKKRQEFEKTKRLKEFKLMRYKERFSKKSNNALSSVFYLLLFVGLLMAALVLMINQQHSSLEQIMLLVNDKIKLQESYAKENIYRSIDLGLLINMYINQINLSVMNPEKVRSLTQHVLQSMKNSIDAMKIRHQFNPFTIDNTIRANKYWVPGWISGDVNSFEMGSYKGEIAYIESVKNYFTIQEIPEADVAGSPTKTHDLIFIKRLPAREFSYIQKLTDFRYLTNVINDQLKYVDPVNGVFARFRQSQKQVLSSILKNKQLMIELLVLTGILFGALRLIMTTRSARELGKRYEISLGTSKKFRLDFSKSTQQLKSGIQEIKKFSRQTTFKILRQQPFNYKQIQEKKTYTIKSIQSCSMKETKNTQYTNFKKGPSTKKQWLEEQKSLMESAGKPFTSSFSSFLFSFLKYPIIATTIVLIICSQNFVTYSNKVAMIQTYSEAIEKLSTINFQVLSLMSQNLFIFSLKTMQLQLNSEESEVKKFEKSFTKAITQVSTTDKAVIIAEMFVGSTSQDNKVEKILYQNICQQFPIEVDCPQYIVPKINGLVQKYGQTIKNINLLFHKITTSNRTEKGLLDTSTYQDRYIETYQNVNELMYINKKIRTMSFGDLEDKIGAKVFTSLTQKQPPVNKFQSDFYLIFCLTGFLILQALLFTFKLYNETKIVSQQFLRVGTSTMMENQKNIVDGYVRYFNIAQSKQWLKKD